jgi:hypothetical protein
MCARTEVLPTFAPTSSDIQGVSRLEDITAAGNFLGHSDQKTFI